jgi:hydroxyethylthiazole kinase
VSYEIFSPYHGGLHLNGQDLADILTHLKETHPLVHHITNYVTVNDCANITMFIGAAPVMAEAAEEVEQMVSMAGALVLNIGTLRAEQVESMLIAGHQANRLNIPIVLDPVGAGATSYRTEVSRRLISKLKIAIIKGNAGEIGTLAGMGGTVRGVDSEGINGSPVEASRTLASKTGTVVVMSGATDIITDGARTSFVENGHELMGKISGTGCMTTSVVAAFAAASNDWVLSSTAALAAFGIAGERAAEREITPYAYKIALMDEVSALTHQRLAERARVRFV